MDPDQVRFTLEMIWVIACMEETFVFVRSLGNEREGITLRLRIPDC